MRSCLRHLAVLIGALAMGACDSRSEHRTRTALLSGQPNVHERSVSDKELSLIKLVARGWNPIEGRTHFLTATAFKEWGTGVHNYESRVYRELLKDGITFGLASETTFNESGIVIERSSRKECWITWISLKWIDVETVEVDSGVWSGPLGGGGGVVIYKYRNGQWIVTKDGIHWVS